MRTERRGTCFAAVRPAPSARTMGRWLPVTQMRNCFTLGGWLVGVVLRVAPLAKPFDSFTTLVGVGSTCPRRGSTPRIWCWLTGSSRLPDRVELSKAGGITIQSEFRAVTFSQGSPRGSKLMNANCRESGDHELRLRLPWPPIRCTKILGRAGRTSEPGSGRMRRVTFPLYGCIARL